MELPDLAMTIGFLVIPPILFFGIVRSRLRAFVYSVVLGWLLMIAGSQFHLAYTPNYDSFAPAVSILPAGYPLRYTQRYGWQLQASHRHLNSPRQTIESNQQKSINRNPDDCYLWRTLLFHEHGL